MFHPSGPTLQDLARQALASTERGYDLLAPRFDYTPFRTPDPIVEGVVAVGTADGPVKTAIDVCCGTGVGLVGLRPYVTDRLVGIDFSAGMLAEAKQAADRVGGAELVKDDVLTHAFAPEFELATCFGALGHFRNRDQSRLVAQVHAALVPGGRFVFPTAERVPITSRQWWLYRGFNAVMRVRNAVLRPPFIMYYLNFLLPRATKVLTEAGFEVQVRHGAIAAPYDRYVVVVATKR
jgi:ubiquinone/menaquinone biosynthesis C-methylase UbiE